MNQNRGWIGVDLDSTLAYYDGWKGHDSIGEPIPEMVARVKKWIEEGQEVRLFTARIYPFVMVDVHIDLATIPLSDETHKSVTMMREWCLKHIGHVLSITCIKDFSMKEVWDDRCVQVIPNSGKRADGKD